MSNTCNICERDEKECDWEHYIAPDRHFFTYQHWWVNENGIVTLYVKDQELGEYSVNPGAILLWESANDKSFWADRLEEEPWLDEPWTDADVLSEPVTQEEIVALAESTAEDVYPCEGILEGKEGLETVSTVLLKLSHEVR